MSDDYDGDGDDGDIDINYTDHLEKNSSVDENEETKDIEEEESKDLDDGDIIPIQPQINPNNKNKYIYTNKKTSKFMTIYEYTRLIGAYADILDKDIPIDKKISEIAKEKGIDNSLRLAELILNDIEIPFDINIERPTGDNEYEVWNPRELILPQNQKSFKRFS